MREADSRCFLSPRRKENWKALSPRPKSCPRCGKLHSPHPSKRAYQPAWNRLRYAAVGRHRSDAHQIDRMVDSPHSDPIRLLRTRGCQRKVSSGSRRNRRSSRVLRLRPSHSLVWSADWRRKPAGDDLILSPVSFYGRFFLCRYEPRPQSPWVVGDPVPAIGGLVVALTRISGADAEGSRHPGSHGGRSFGHSRMKLRVAILKPIATARPSGRRSVRRGGPDHPDRRGVWVVIRTGDGADAILPARAAASGAAAGYWRPHLQPAGRVLVAVELLLFEFRARLFIRSRLLQWSRPGCAFTLPDLAPLFPMPAFSLLSHERLWLFGLMGVVTGASRHWPDPLPGMGVEICSSVFQSVGADLGASCAAR